VAQTFFADPFVQASFRLDGVVCVCDAANFDTFEGSAGNEDVVTLLREQLGLSDVVLLNKCDLVDSARRDALGGKIRSLNPSAKVVPCRQGKVNLQQVLKIGSFSLESALSLDPHFLGNAQNFEPEHGHGHGHDGDGHDHGELGGEKRNHAHEGFGSLGLEVDDPINLQAFKNWMKSVVESHGDHLVRVKGVLLAPSSATGQKPKRVIVQGVGGHIEIGDEVEMASDAVKKSRLVFIGRFSFELAASLRKGFHGTTLSSNAVETDLAVAMDTESSAKM
jgi:G3E family GTPase